jgi:hypothetical protein
MNEAETGRWTALILIPAFTAFMVWVSVKLGETGIGRGPTVYRDKSPFWFWLIVGIWAVLGLAAFVILLRELVKLIAG